MLAMNSPRLRWLGELEQRKRLEIILILSISQAQSGAKPIFHFVFSKNRSATNLRTGISFQFPKPCDLLRLRGRDLR